PATGSSPAKGPSIRRSNPSSRAPAGTSARAAVACCARSAAATARTWLASPRAARAAPSSSASVTPLIADTTTTSGSGRWAKTIATAWPIAAASASDAPPNLWMWGGRVERARALAIDPSVGLVPAGRAVGVKRLRNDAAGSPGPHHRVAHGAHAVGGDHRDNGRSRAGERGTVRARLPRGARHFVVSGHEGAAKRHVQHVVQPGGQESRVGVRQAVDQGGTLRGRTHGVGVRQGGRQRGT